MDVLYVAEVVDVLDELASRFLNCDDIHEIVERRKRWTT